MRNTFPSRMLGLVFLTFQLSGCGSGGNNLTAPPGAPSTGGAGVVVGTGGGGGTGSASFVVGTGGASGVNVCLGPNPPAACNMVAPPGCGDGKVNQPSEQCDDGNTLAGDGCNGTCQIEPNYTCPPLGGACTLNFRCGDGVVNPGEACDQGQYQGSPGCSADCKTQDPGYKCLAGQPCVPVNSCGNGRIESGETCDPPKPGNGCSATCQTEAGWRCIPGSCTRLPYCGDGIVQASMGEKCDEGQYQGSPGCSADCLSQDATCTCVPGQACVCQKPVCGDGIVQVGEQCDDGNSTYPGCSATCQLEPGYTCPFAGAPCVPVCGDGILIPGAEQCDPGTKIPNIAQACVTLAQATATAPACTLKPGWVCSATSCHQTVCGDGIVEGSEGCDVLPKNNDLGDGCTPTCMKEPTCPPTGGACTSVCGDGLVIGNEACDDGNVANGDGCSSTCTVEPGYQCAQPPLGPSMDVPVVYRDFNQGADFEVLAALNQNYANQGLLQGTLDAQGLKPVLVSTTGTYKGTPATTSYITSPASYAQWYKDAVAGPNTYHASLATMMTLWLNAAGNAYVNRYGDGTGVYYGTPSQPQYIQWGTARWCSDATCTNCNAPAYNPATDTCMQPCIPWNNTNACVATRIPVDGNPAFFPVDSLTPPSAASTASIPVVYGGWSAEPGGKIHNFSFTSEVRFWFKFTGTQTLDFTGDDDVWVFINKHLAVDLGGIHTPVDGHLVLNANGTAAVTVSPTETYDSSAFVSYTSTPNLGLTNNAVFEIAVFQAERRTLASTYKLTLSGFNAAHSACHPICGDGVVSPGEQCDNGTQNGPGYNQCTTQCLLGPRCGDAVVQNPPEDCDNGKNTDGYAATGSNACAPGCKLPPYCGDGKVQLDYGEQCDNGNANADGLYGGCTTSCQLGPYCGDAIVNGPEACDDGVNDGTYNTCSPGCVLPPRCGDGIIQTDWGEQCEPISSNDPNCTADCKLPGYCGDGVKDTAAGEQCDYGTAENTGAYGGCNSNCTLAPYCGDGIKNGPEQCDSGAALNTGDYGGCTSTCLLAPYCGDGTIQPAYEQCDDGVAVNGASGSMCSSACKFLVNPTT